MTDPAGPIWSGGFEETVVSEAGVDYTLQFLPDKHNDLLQQEGKPPVYYWLMNGVRLASKQNGALDFFMLQFFGIQSGDTNVGVAPGQTREAAGGALSFTVTTAPPDGSAAAAAGTASRSAAAAGRSRRAGRRPGCRSSTPPTTTSCPAC